MKDKPADDAAEPSAKAKDESGKSAETAPDAEKQTSDGNAATAGTTEEAPAVEKGKARRKSGVPDHVKGGKKLNKKGSKAKILHIDAKPGDHFFAKLKGFPPWPVVVSEEDMLPQTMISSRPVTAARPDGTYREDFADGGKRIADRTFPVMYLYTNEL
jgi:hypothetical protein